MFIPGPGFADQGEAVARIAEALLQELAGVAGDEVGGSGGIAVMQDAGDGQGRAAFGAPQRGVEVVEGAVAVVERGAGREVEAFGATTPELERMAAWLLARNVVSVAMESTGVYWIAPHEVLERTGLR